MASKSANGIFFSIISNCRTAGVPHTAHSGPEGQLACRLQLQLVASSHFQYCAALLGTLVSVVEDFRPAKASNRMWDCLLAKLYCSSRIVRSPWPCRCMQHTLCAL
jgi:hypothetical protein